MISFLRAYDEGRPVAVRLKDVGTFLVVGFVQTDSYVAFMDDGFLNPAMGVRPSYHFLSPKVTLNKDLSLSCPGARFYPLAEGDPFLEYYDKHFVSKPPIDKKFIARSLYGQAEHRLRLRGYENALREANRERDRGAN